GYQYVLDSNLDWGQDLKRLAQFVHKQGIQNIYLEYFGSADPAYYLGEKWTDNNGCGQQPTGWIAVSAMDTQGSPWRPDCDYRRWLRPIQRPHGSVIPSLFFIYSESAAFIM